MLPPSTAGVVTHSISSTAFYRFFNRLLPANSSIISSPQIGISCRFSAQISHPPNLVQNRTIHACMPNMLWYHELEHSATGRSFLGSHGTGLVIITPSTTTKFFSIERPHRHENPSSRRWLYRHLRPPAGTHPWESRLTCRTCPGRRGASLSSFAHLSRPSEGRSIHDRVRPEADSARDLGRLCE